MVKEMNIIASRKESSKMNVHHKYVIIALFFHLHQIKLLREILIFN
jgi:hypothetical protein